MPLGKRKRSLQLQPHQYEELHQTIADQIDLEIALKKRLLAASHARLEWALILKNAISNQNNGHTASLTAFRDAALASFEAIEAPCRFITSGSDVLFLPSNNGKTSVVPDIRASEPPRTRKRVTLGLAVGPSTGPILFEDRSSSTFVTVKLVCSDCSRCDFPTMQGFLNHCRLAHSRSYGTHDECIQACGVFVDASERETLLAAGVEINTIHLPSLKGLFERAVGLVPNKPFGLDAAGLLSQSGGDLPMVSTHLSQTLGLHEGSPALAPFLGKEVKKKCIHVYDESDHIDIITTDESSASMQRMPWLARRERRRDPDGEWSINMTALAAQKTENVEGPHHVLNEPINGQSSRFHVTRRVLISDRSLYLPETKRPSGTESASHTHRWQLSVSSPSYGQHITAFLTRFTITCVTQPPVFARPIIISEPPFIACSTTDRPFLARLTLEWAGEHNNAFEVEHWVELDQLKAVRPVSGDEQILDIELDRNTDFLPVSEVAYVVPWTGDGDYGGIDPCRSPVTNAQVASRVDTPTGSKLEAEHIKLLRSIIPRFPITLQDLGPRQTRPPYVLYPSRAKFLSLLPGRRKAIEWSRALAIRFEYDALVASSASFGDKVQLTTADVYRWLDSEGLFPRRRPKPEKPAPQRESAQVVLPPGHDLKALQWFCPVCGVDVRFHAPDIFLFNSHETRKGEMTGFRCPAELGRHRTPLVHVYALVAPLRIPYWALRYDRVPSNITWSTSRDFVTLVHPQLTRFVRQEVRSLNLPRFDTAHETEEGLAPFQDHDLTFGSNRQEAEAVLAPYAFLGLVLEKAVKDLVGSALQVARENQSRKVTADRTLGSASVSLLTPTHVLQGLLKGAEMGGPKEALFKCLSRVGTLLEVGRVTGSTHGGGSAPPMVAEHV